MNAKHFLKISAVVLLATAAAKIFSVFGEARLLAMQDALLNIGYRPLMVVAALLEVAVASYLLGSRNDLRRAIALVWLSGNFMAYHIGSYLTGVQLCPCLGRLGDKLPVPRGFSESLLQTLVLFWFAGGLYIIWREMGARQSTSGAGIDAGVGAGAGGG
jgi:hypothetical protein